jgi:uncharacterized protein with HEPN domain
MSGRTDVELVADILEASERIASYTAGMNRDTFLADQKTQDAVIRNLEIVGEATKGLSESLRSAHDEIPWKSMAGLRDRLIHSYFGVNLDIVWQIASVEMPQVAGQLRSINEGSSGT